MLIIFFKGYKISFYKYIINKIVTYLIIIYLMFNYIFKECYIVYSF